MDKNEKLISYGSEDSTTREAATILRKNNRSVVIREPSEYDEMIKAKKRRLNLFASEIGKGKAKEVESSFKEFLPYVSSSVTILPPRTPNVELHAINRRILPDLNQLPPSDVIIERTPFYLNQMPLEDRVASNESIQSDRRRKRRESFMNNAVKPPSVPLRPSKRSRLMALGKHFHPRTPNLICSTNIGRTPLTECHIETSHFIHDEIDLNIMPLNRDLEDDFLSTIPDTSVAVPSNGLMRNPVSFGDQINRGDELNIINISVQGDTGRHFLGEMNVECPYCGALHWMDEKLQNSSRRNPIFGICCNSGKIRIPLLNTPPPSIKALYDENDSQSKSFQKDIRQYNAALSFTSLGVKLDPRVLNGRGPSSFVIQGELRHRTGSLMPEPEQEAAYAQLYIYDPEAALQTRCRRNPNLREDVFRIIQDCLLHHNPFPAKFHQAHEILCRPGVSDKNIPVRLHYSTASDRRRYNLPSADEIAVILPGDGTDNQGGMRDIILHLKGHNGLKPINECHPAYFPLHYVLLFPRGELGWEPGFKKWNVLGNCASTDRLTQMDFYSYRLFQRHSEYSTILRAGKLFQEFVVDAWAATEQNRLSYIKQNQDKLRSELYKDLAEVIVREGTNADQVGRKMILSSSFLGSPRHMFEIFQDSMAITRYNHHPDIFLTMTANPKCREITSALLPYQTSADRPDLVARVFELKRRALLKEIEKDKVFGKKVAHVFTVEYQKRGLPHMHLLLFLAGADKIRTCSQVDKIVSAEIPDQDADPLLYETVVSCMIHSCGASCMENGVCRKRYPKPYADSTSMQEDGYPLYRRRNTGQTHLVRGKEVDNRHVVPYNPHLSRMFDCHINVEVCAGMICVKYINKYIYKGHDCTTMVIGGIDEIQQYLDARYIGPPEAIWRIFGYTLHGEFPSVTRLAIHLPGMHHVNYNPDHTSEEIAARVAAQVSTLTAFFAYNAANPLAPKYTYHEFPQFFVFRSNEWKPRKQGFAIGRMYFASPNSGERFYLRLLLTHVKGPSSFENLRTVNGITYSTFKLACVASGLIEDDDEWVQCLQETVVMQTGYQLRRLFSTILSQCSPIHPYDLWKQFSVHICDDLGHKIRTQFGIPNPSALQVEDYGLYLLDQLLHEAGKCLSDFPPMPESTGDWSTFMGNKLIWAHRQLHISAVEQDVDDRVNRLNHAQMSAYSAIYSSVLESRGTTFFLNGGAGTGKTYLYNTIALKCRSLGHTVITVASSGIASLLLIGGRTAHSTFCIPIDIQANSICGFTKQSVHAELFREAKLIIWDEVPMQHRHCVEAVDRSLRDIRNHDDKPFGGITVVLGGDFRQVLPVVPRGVRTQIVGATLKRSHLWHTISILTLEVNMRLEDTSTLRLDFVKFLMEIGSNPEEVVLIPSTIQKCEHLRHLLDSVYPQLEVSGIATPTFLTDRTILSARNDDVNYVNNMALNIFPGETITYLAADKICDDDESRRNIANRYPNEYLNSLDPPGLPPFKLDLKVGCPIMLLRNLAPNDGLCNGTRLMVVRCAPRILESQILTGDKAGNLVFIPRISLTPSTGELPFHMTRRQFPIRLAFAMTINKAQGQSVKFVGVDLRTPVFSHGQLYVAFSRCTSPDRISCLLPQTSTNSTINIVYPEVLL